MQAMRTPSLAHRQLFAAPFLGALAGFLVNRMHHGSTGWGLFFEMAAGTALFTIGAGIVGQFAQWQEVARRRVLEAAQAEIEAEESRRIALIQAEQERTEQARAEFERVLSERRDTATLRAELARSRKDTLRLAGAIAGVVAHLQRRTASLPLAPVADEARGRMEALEVAQRELETRQVELDRKTVREAEEVKQRLLTLTISDSQRLRNIDAPEAEQSGRLIELETRIRKLATEIERLSGRQPAVATDGDASKVGSAGTGDTARLGFLRAMLEANQTLRRQIKEVA